MADRKKRPSLVESDGLSINKTDYKQVFFRLFNQK